MKEKFRTKEEIFADHDKKGNPDRVTLELLVEIRDLLIKIAKV